MGEYGIPVPPDDSIFPSFAHMHGNDGSHIRVYETNTHVDPCVYSSVHVLRTQKN